MKKKKTFGDYFDKGEFTAYEVNHRLFKPRKIKLELKLTPATDDTDECLTFFNRTRSQFFFITDQDEIDKLRKHSRTSYEFLYEEDAIKAIKSYLKSNIKFFEKKLAEMKSIIETL